MALNDKMLRLPLETKSLRFEKLPHVRCPPPIQLLPEYVAVRCWTEPEAAAKGMVTPMGRGL